VSATEVLDRLKRAARRRRGWIVAMQSLPLVLAAGALAWRVAGAGALTVAIVIGAAVTGALILRALRPLDHAWAARQLDAHRPDLEDSTALLITDPVQLTRLQQLQRERVERRLDDSEPPDLRPAWPGRALALCWALGAVLAAAALLAPRQPIAMAPAESPAATVGDTAAGEPRLVERRLDIEPPAYTGLPARREDALDAKLPAGAKVRWRLRFEPEPASVELVFHDGSRTTLVTDAGSWTAQRTMERSALYRVALGGNGSEAGSPLHRLEVTPDRPPAIRIVTPSQSVTLHEPGQRRWLVEFEVGDDYGLGPARLHVTFAQGGGENVTVTERSLPVRGEGDPRQRRYTHRLDLASLGLAAGDDVIVRLGVDDNRRPVPNSARSSSLILRWPPSIGTETAGMEGIVQQTMPAYFRSQRQVIIDTEALVAERRSLDTGRFVNRSDAIGVDQRLLRLRYGQFLGEEAEDTEHAGATAQDEHEGEDHPRDEEAPVAGTRETVTERFGHVHDIPEAATLLDRETRELLRSALREMWQAELHLRQGQPERALPYEYRALDRIKQVQQASRIYLARVGLELPPVDMARRLTGDATGVRSRGDPLVASTGMVTPAASLWQMLSEPSAAGDAEASRRLASGLAELERWVGARESELPQGIDVLAAIDELRNDPQCVDCRNRLGALLWTLLPVPASATGTRAEGGTAGTAYLEALRREPAP
jgi:hypothetical protein